MTQHQQIDFLGDKLTALRELKKIIPEFSLTGSVSLITYGVVGRKIGDIDIIVPCLSILDSLNSKYDVKYQSKSEEALSIEKNESFQATLKIGDISVCVFEDNEPDFKIVDFLTVGEVKVTHPRKSIKAKRKYVEEIKITSTSNEKIKAYINKHLLDIAAYEKSGLF